MARPPIIISNGGIAGILSKGLCRAADDKDAEKKLMANIDGMKESPSVVKIIKTEKGKEAHCLYWRLNGEAKYEDAQDEETKEKKYKDGKETVTINELLDPYQRDSE